MFQYKFYFFELRGLGELVRLVFAAAEQKYEDIRFPREKWPEFKPKSPFGQAPVLEVIDGSNTLTLTQSKAIARYLARKFGLAGKTDEESAIIDMYGDQLADFIVEWLKMRLEQNEEKKKELQEKLQKEILPPNLKFFEDRLAASGSGYITSGLSWVDLFLYNIVDLFPNKDEVLKPYKHIKENREKIEANPGVAQWLKVRPLTES